MLDLKEAAPCYIYDSEMIRSACKKLKQSLPGFDFLYSVKTNPFDPVVRCVSQQGFGTDAASLNEVKKSRACGVQPCDIFYSSPGKQEEDIQDAWGQCTIVADSLHEIEMIQRVASSKNERVEIGLRVHPAIGMDGASSGSSKFGIDLENVHALRETLSACPYVIPTGIHVHLKSQVLDADILARYYLNVMEIALMLQKELKLNMRFVNFGSGIGTVYDEAKDTPVDLEKLNDLLRPVHTMNQTLHTRLLIETGRFVVCQAGKYITPVVDQKVSHGITYLIVRNGLNGFMRPAIAAMLKNAVNGGKLPAMEPLFTQAKEFEVRVLNETTEQETVTVVGNLCTAMDVIAENICINKAEIGDLIEISNAGSYAYTLSPLMFASIDPPHQFMV